MLKMDLKRRLGTCCPEPECDLNDCSGCPYIEKCQGDPQRNDYCPRPRNCRSCGADCLQCQLWQGPRILKGYTKLGEGDALFSLGIRATVRDGKQGLTLPNPTKPGETLFIEASDQKPGFIIAAGQEASHLQGAKKTRCADCKRKVWISKSTQEMLRRWPGTPVICLNCFVKRVEQENKKEK